MLLSPQETFLTRRAALLAQAHALPWRAVCQQLGQLTDALLLTCWAEIEGMDPALPAARLLALGSYGRGELVGFSDLDLLIELTEEGAEQRDAVQRAVERFVSAVRAARVRLAQRVRTPSQGHAELARDLRTPTSLLDARHLRPDPRPDAPRVGSAEALAFLRDDDQGQRFAATLLREHRVRREDHTRAVALLEPDLKVGAGALRDLHTLRWGALVCQQPAPDVERALDWLMTIRHRLHAHAGRRQDRLSFAEQRRLAAPVDLRDPTTDEPVATLEDLMEAHYRVTRPLCTLVDRSLRAWSSAASPVAPPHRASAVTPLDALDAIYAATQADTMLAPALEAAIQAAAPGWGDEALAPAVQQRLLALWTAPDTSERFSAALLELGVLPALVPELRPLVCHVQPDVSHVYTTDEHTLRCVERARRLLNGRADSAADRWADFRAIAQRLDDPGLLLLAALCHDIGKNRGGDHSELGAQMVLASIAPRMGLDPARSAKLAFLVREHLILSKIARRRDLSDPAVIDEVAQRVRAPELLDQLVCLTFCDMSTVAPGAVNDWIATLLLTLYRRARAQVAPSLGGPPSLAELKARRVEQITDRLVESGLEADSGRARAIARDLARQLPHGHLLHAELDALCRQALVWAEAAQTGGAVTRWTPLEAAGVLELLVVAPDTPGLLARIAGATVTAGLTVLTAEILTTPGKQALDLFRVMPAAAGASLMDVASGPRLERAKARVERALTAPMEEIDHMVAAYLAERRLAPAPGQLSPVEVRVLQEVSESANVLEIRAPDRPGLLYAIARTLHRFGVDTTFSKLDIVGPRVVDTFYIGDARGRRLEAEALSSVVEGLRAAIE